MIFPRINHDFGKPHNIARESQAQEIYHDLAPSILAWWQPESEHVPGVRNPPVSSQSLLP